MDEKDLKRLLEANSAETRRHFDGVVDRLDTSAAETRRHFDVSTERIESEFQLLAEAVAEMDEKFERRFEALEERVDRGFAETQAMIKFSHALSGTPHPLMNLQRM